MLKVLVASRNAKKLKELQRVLVAHNVAGIQLLSLDDVVEYPETPESGVTFEDNARIKAADGVAHTGLITLADDSGLCVNILRGMPGIFSARWAGQHGDDEANNRLLLAQLSDIPDSGRHAHYVSTCVLQLPRGLYERLRAVSSSVAEDIQQEYVVTGQWDGKIITEPTGDEGFGYDPIFVAEEEPGRTVAQLSAERKDELSHRGRALAQLVEPLRHLASAYRSLGQLGQGESVYAATEQQGGQE